MGKYAVKVVETLSRTYIVDAESFYDAIGKVQDKYREEDIVFNYDDYEDTDFVATDTFGCDEISDDDSRLNYFTILEE